MWVSNARRNPVSRVEPGGVAARINKSSQVNFYLDSHRIVINTNQWFWIQKWKIVKEENNFFNVRFIVQSLGRLNSS